MSNEQIDEVADAVADRLETSDVLADAVAAKLGGQIHELRGQFLELSHQLKDGFTAVDNRLDGIEAAVADLGNRMEVNERFLRHFYREFDEFRTRMTGTDR
ncbi:MAG: hypothetical protein OXR82_08450 [Gammaproteobacteria bacterium]|nr:hypothetical protein [Gammaproteobacteria bacterium]MDE0258396.1 hypothetical protein [Gammaproteobacteria bacterium]